MDINELWRIPSNVSEASLYQVLFFDSFRKAQKASYPFSEELVHCYLYGRFSNKLPNYLDEEDWKNDRLTSRAKVGQIWRALKRHYMGTPCFLDVFTPREFVIRQSTLPGRIYGLFTTQWIKEKTDIGPFTGTILWPCEIQTRLQKEHIWEVFDEQGSVIYFIDANNNSSKNWICYVNCARSDDEQNLDLVQHNEALYYRANQDIPPGQELLVWYASNSQLFLGIPEETRDKVAIKRRRDTNQHAASSNTKCSLGRLKCTICRRAFNSRSNLRSHMRIHTLEKPFRCKYCRRSFSQSSTLRNHTRLHTGEKPYRCHVCRMAYSQLAGLRAHQKSAKHKR